MSKVNLAKGPYTVTSTTPETEYYKFEDERTKTGALSSSTSGLWDVNDKTEKPEEVKASDIPYEEYIKVVHENELLKQIIVELNKKLYWSEK